MTDKEILAELRTIRTLLALDKEEELNQFSNGLSEAQEHILSKLEYDEWSSLSSSTLADDLDSSTRTIQRETSDLVEKNLIEKKGAGRGTKYRKTGLLKATEMIGKN